VTKALASKSAGLRLLLIMAILAVPMLLFGYSYWQQANKAIEALEQERIGSELTQIAMAQHLARMEKLPPYSLKRIRYLEQKLGIEEAENYESHFYNKIANEDEHQHGSEKVLGYIGDIASRSRLILDSDETGFHLATALTVSLPTLIADADNVIKQLNLKDSGTNARFRLAMLHGHMLGAFEKMEDSINRSKASSDNEEKYDRLNASGALIKKSIVQFGNQFMFGMASGDNAVMRQQVRDIRGVTHAMLVPGYEMLNQNIEMRISTQKTRLLYMSVVGLLSAALALGLAASMFSSTLKRLDVVEAAQKHSEEMRAETDRVNQEVAALNNNLSQKLVELKLAQDELLNKGKLEQLGQLTATVAHEIRNPLGAVRTSAFLIARKLNGKNTGIEPQLERINNGVARCDMIITQLLDFSRTKEVQTQTAELDDWLEKILKEDGDSLPGALGLDCRLGLGATQVNFDSTRLRRAILNLINNASEAMLGKDKDAAQFETIDPQVTISTHIRGDDVCIDVTDNGPGMPAEVLARIREPLFTTKNFGTGLGIPAVEQISIQHGGRLEIQSQPGVGSTFTICLPLKKPSERIAA
jgi:signal transduction histidine kinase